MKVKTLGNLFDHIKQITVVDLPFNFFFGKVEVVVTTKNLFNPIGVMVEQWLEWTGTLAKMSFLFFIDNSAR